MWQCLFIYLVLKGGRNLLLRLLIRSFSGHLAIQTLPSFHQWILRSFGRFFGVKVHPYLWARSQKPMSGFLMLAPISWITKHNKIRPSFTFPIRKKKTSLNFFNYWRWWDSCSQKVGYMDSFPGKFTKKITDKMPQPRLFVDKESFEARSMWGFCLKSNFWENHG